MKTTIMLLLVLAAAAAVVSADDDTGTVAAEQRVDVTAVGRETTEDDDSERLCLFPLPPKGVGAEQLFDGTISGFIQRPTGGSGGSGPSSVTLTFTTDADD